MRWLAGVIRCRFDFDKQVAMRLGEMIVHREDIRRPLGIRRDYPIETLTLVAKYYVGSDLGLTPALEWLDRRIEFRHEAPSCRSHRW